MTKALCLFLLSCFSFVMAEPVTEEKVIWIDVRTFEEFETGHLEQAIHIPYQEIADKIESVSKDKQAKIKVYCKVGGRASLAKKALEQLGYTNVINAGGYLKILESMSQKP